jgi:hypothetical protein
LAQPLSAAVEQRGIDIKWVYHSPEQIASDKALTAQWQWLNSRFSDWRDRAGEKGIKYLEVNISNVEQRAREASERIQSMDEAQRNRAGSWELYESCVPHFYLAFLSVPRKHISGSRPTQAPDGTFGFVHLYPMFPEAYETRCALYLEIPGEILNYYYWSTVRLFDEGKERAYLHRIWPSDEVVPSP